uniref:Uncharacterized protein n=1 Tax=Molossus molossus TaxID=27622 RepID=A0A7J8E329_MOLMO|nr:hypothetical protein HJG59_009051 [Molossus molossus]
MCLSHMDVFISFCLLLPPFHSIYKSMEKYPLVRINNNNKKKRLTENQVEGKERGRELDASRKHPYPKQGSPNCGRPGSDLYGAGFIMQTQSRFLCFPASHCDLSSTGAEQSSWRSARRDTLTRI